MLPFFPGLLLANFVEKVDISSKRCFPEGAFPAPCSKSLVIIHKKRGGMIFPRQEILKIVYSSGGFHAG